MKQHSFPALEQALGGYLHQDYLCDYSSYDEAIRSFATIEPRDLVDSAERELRRFAEFVEQSSTPSELLLQLGCYYDPVADGMTVGNWLQQVGGYFPHPKGAGRVARPEGGVAQTSLWMSGLQSNKRLDGQRSDSDHDRMTKPRRVDDALYVHFITFSCYHRRRLLDHDQPKRILLGILSGWPGHRFGCLGDAGTRGMDR